MKITSILFIIVFSFTLGYSQTEWTDLGPGNGNNLTCLYMDTQYNRLFAGNLEGFWYYHFSTQTWTAKVEEGSIGREVRSITSLPFDANRIITGRMNAWFKGYIEVGDTLDNFGEISFSSEGGAITDVQFCPSDPNTLFACGWSDINPGDLLRSVDGGFSWQQLTGYYHQAMTSIAINHHCSDSIFLAGDALVTRSFDGGNSWETATNGLPAGQGVYSLVIDPYMSNSLLCSNDNGIYRTKNGGDNWELVSDVCIKHFVYNPQIEGIVSAISFSPYTLLISYNHGDTWVDITGTFPGENMVDIVFAGDGIRLLLASSTSVFSKDIDLVKTDRIRSTGQILFFPNPARHKISFRTDIPLETVHIYNLQGHLVESKGVFNGQMDISSLAGGIYFLEIISKTQSFFKKLIVL
jgi:hypothetical protein